MLLNKNYKYDYNRSKSDFVQLLRLHGRIMSSRDIQITFQVQSFRVIKIIVFSIRLLRSVFKADENHGQIVYLMYCL